MQCKQMLIHLVEKLMAKTPLNFSLVRHATCLDPESIRTLDQDVTVEHFKCVLNTLKSSKKN